MFKENGLEAIILNSAIDSHFINFLEMNESGVQFNRIDSDLTEVLKDTAAGQDENASKELEQLFKANLGNDKLNIKVESLKATRIPAIMLLSEQSRRMQEMSAMFGGMDAKSMFPNEETLVLNRNSDLINSLISLNQSEDKKETAKMICEHIYDLALIGNKQLDADSMAKFIERSNKILEKIV
jgi:molecular chaperone HtpG